MGSEQKRAFIAVILSGVVLFTWQHFFAPKQQKVDAEQAKTQVVAETSKSSTTQNTNGEAQAKTIEPIVANNPVSMATQELSKENTKVTLGSDLVLSSFESKTAVFPFTEIVGENADLRVLVDDGSGFKAVNFAFSEATDSKVKATDAASGINILFELDSEGRLLYGLRSPKPVNLRFVFNSAKKELESRQMREFTYLSSDVDREVVGDDSSFEGSVKWAGIDFHYHIFSVVFGSKTPALIKTNEDGSSTVTTTKAANDFKGYFVFAKKNYDSLVKLGDNLDLSVDFGVFGILAVPILRGLQFFYKYIPNYGVAIILLTLVIRLITFPLQYKSFKSMKKMQKIQPELNKLKEKFKDDPQRMQRETMELFKRAGANPLGGCLPLLLQMPVFFAFYKVLYSAVELVGAPFAFWISDLSIKDPYFVLPVFMVVVMFAQQKLTPTASADPTQQKVMMFMPLIFGFIMKDLPAGLVLYICVSTLFGIIQQLFVYRTTD